MSTITKNTIANFLFVLVLALVAAGLFLLGAEPMVIVVGVVGVGIVMKFDEYRIRKARRNV